MVDDPIVVMRKPSLRPPRRSFMTPEDMRHLRQNVIRCSQKQLAEQMIDPNTGAEVKNYQVYRWEAGRVLVPLWAARLVRALADEARKYDAEGR